jgi:hypothetical protein
MSDRTMPNNKSDSILRGNEIWNRYIEISADRNVIKKEAEKILKYEDLII